MTILYALVARGNTVLAEYTFTSGNFPTITRVLLGKIPEQDGKMSYVYDQYVFHYVVENKMTSFKRRVPFAFLDDVKNRFSRPTATRARRRSRSHNEDFGRTIQKQLEFYNGPQADQFATVHKKLDDVKNVMVQNIEMGVSFRRSSSAAEKEEAKASNPGGAPRRARRRRRPRAGGPARLARGQGPKTGRTYYYDVLTRETQWTKPRELQDDRERAAIDAKNAEKRQFFDEMERNMRKNFAAGLTSVDIQEPDGGRGSYASGSQTCRSRRRRSLSPQTAAWWGEVEATKQGPRAAAAAREQGKQNRSQRTVSFAEEKESLARDLAAGAPSKTLAKPEVARSRNSTGTMYVTSTLDAPDKEATIKCLECIVTSLIYVERLLKAARGKVKLRASNWRPVLLSCMIMASKVCDDLSMWNADFSHICAAFTLKRINDLEAALLAAYGFNATVPASEYAKYYFHLRSMAARLGLGGDAGDDIKPLDVAAAKQVANRSFKFAKDPKAKPDDALSADLAKMRVRRAVSVGGTLRPSRRYARDARYVVDMNPKSSRAPLLFRRAPRTDPRAPNEPA
ncbi:SNAP receptor [Aureococcus anophagefferens]|nr:SNAP receptor [Aureococcus anophagefferens]